MKKLLIILLMTSCASAKTYDYKAEGKQGVYFKKANKQKTNYFKVVLVAGIVGYFIIQDND